MDEIIKNEDLYSIIEKYFIKHLEIPNNNRIIFSAKFGKGKTTFLKEFFTNQPGELKKKYNFFHLFSVNYPVATNEDIFRFPKYDIIIEFLRKEIEHDFFEFTFLEKID